MRNARVLLIDDDQQTRWSLATVLRREGVHVNEANNGLEAMALLRSGNYDLVISDVCMPGLGGFGVFAALRFGEGDEYADHRLTPVMLVSGQATRAELARAFEGGVDEFLVKPIDPQEFKARVRAVLQRRRTDDRKSRTAGDLRDFGMASLTQALQLAGRNARVRVRSGENTGELDFLQGNIVNATFSDAKVQVHGDSAAVCTIALEKGTFEIHPLPGKCPRTVMAETNTLVIQAKVFNDERA